MYSFNLLPKSMGHPTTIFVISFRTRIYKNEQNAWSVSTTNFFPMPSVSFIKDCLLFLVPYEFFSDILYIHKATKTKFRLHVKQLFLDYNW